MARIRPKRDICASLRGTQNRFPVSKAGYMLPILMEMTVATVISDYKHAKRDADVSAPCAARP